MTLRDYFAAKAIQSLIRNDNQNYLAEKQTASTYLDIATKAYVYADAMLKAREK